MRGLGSWSVEIERYFVLRVRLRPIYLKLVVLLLLGLFALRGSSAAAAEVVRTGVLQAEVKDDFAHGESTTSYSLQPENAERAVPVVSAHPSSAELGDVVAVTGDMQSGKLVGSIETLSDEEAEPTVPGVRKVAVLLVRFPTDPVEPWSPNNVRERVFTASFSANAFYQEESFGQISLTGKLNPEGDIFGWLTIDGSTEGCPYHTWDSKAREAAEAAGVSLEGYDHIIYEFTKRVCAWGAVGQQGGHEINILRGNMTPFVFEHELGHNLGLWHANRSVCMQGEYYIPYSQVCKNEEYGDIYDVMGVDERHSSNANLAQLGILKPENIKTVASSGIYTIKAPQHQTSEPTIVRVPWTTDGQGHTKSWFYLEIREPVGTFENFLDESMMGVLIRVVTDPSLGSDYTYLIDTDPSPSLYDAPLDPGKTIDAGTVKFTTLNASNGSATVEVELFPDEVQPSTPKEFFFYLQNEAGINLYWTQSGDNVGVSRYHLFRDGEEITTTTSSSTHFLDGTASIGQHTYTVYAEDEAGNRSSESPPLTVAIVDKSPPTMPTNVVAVQQGSDVDVTWTPSTDNVGVAGYRVLRAGRVIGTSASPSFVDKPRPGYVQTYTVEAEDEAGNRSKASAPVKLTVLDVTPPTAPTNVSAVQKGNEVDIKWIASTDDVFVAKYRIIRDGEEISSTNGITVNMTDFTATLGEHTYILYAEDSVGNTSPPSVSETVSFVDSTPPSPGSPPSSPPDSPSSPPTAGVDVGHGPAAGPIFHWRRGPLGQLIFTVDATANPDVVRVGLRLNGKLLRSRRGGALRYVWWPTGRRCGRIYDLTAYAFDASGTRSVSVARIQTAECHRRSLRRGVEGMELFGGGSFLTDVYG